MNDAVYVAGEIDPGPPLDDPENPPTIKWSATGKEFQHPVVFKTLFSKEDIVQKDYVETKQVAKGHMYLVTPETEHKQFIGRFGAGVPGYKGRWLLRSDGEKEHAVNETKGYLWETDDIAFEVGVEVEMACVREEPPHLP